MKIGLFPFSFFLFIPLFPFARHGYILYTLAREGQVENRAASNIGWSERIKGDKTGNLGTDRFRKDPPKYDKTASEDFVRSRASLQ